MYTFIMRVAKDTVTIYARQSTQNAQLYAHKDNIFLQLCIH